MRTLLVAPPLRPELMTKALVSSADGVLLELEDGIHPSRKDEARAAVTAAVAGNVPADKTVIVRTNEVTTEEGRLDLVALAASGASDVLIPKVRGRSDVDLAADLLTRAESNAARPIGSTRLWAMVETTSAVLELDEIVRERRLVGLLFGAGDLSAELRVRRVGLGAHRDLWDFPLELVFAMQRTVMVARAHGLAVIDTGYTSFRDLEGTRHAARIAAQFGFDGSLVLSPRQIPIIHEEFTPSDNEYEWAQRAVDAVAEAEELGETVTTVDDEMVEGPLIRNARTIIDRYERGNGRGPAGLRTTP